MKMPGLFNPFRRVVGIYARKTCLLALLLAVLLVATGITFSHVLLTPPEKLSGMYDIYRYYAPLAFFNDVCLHNGEWPFWNPLTYCGMPNAGNPQSFIFYPPYLLRSLFIGTPTQFKSQASLALLMGLHFTAIAFFAVLLGRDHKLSWPASFTAALGFTFSAIVVRRLCEYHYITALAWFPLLLLCVKRTVDASTARQVIKYTIAGGLLLGLTILSGFLQVINLIVFILGLYGLIYGLLGAQGSRERLNVTGRTILVIGAICIIGLAIASPLLGSAWELSKFTERESGTVMPKYSDLWAWDLTRFYQSLVVFAGMKYEAETIRNFGILGLVLAAIGLTHPNRRLVITWASIYLILLDCSLGPPMPFATLVEKLTPFSLSAYSRAYDFALLPLAMLAALGVDALWSRRLPCLRTILIVYIALATLVPLRGWISTSYYLPVSANVVIIPALSLALLLVAVWIRQQWYLRLVCLALPFLIFAEEYSWNKHYVPQLTRAQFREHAPIRTGVTTLPQTNVREADPIPNRFLLSLRPSMNGAEPLYIRRVKNLVNGGARASHPFRSVRNEETTRDNQLGNLLLKRRLWLSQQYVLGSLPDKLRMFPPTTTTFLSDKPEAPIPQIPLEAASKEPISLDPKKQIIKFSGAGSKTTAKRIFRLDFRLPKTAGPAGVIHSALCLEYLSTGPAQIDTWLEEPDQKRSTWAKRYNVAATGENVQTVIIPLPDYARVKASITVVPNKKVTSQLIGAYILTDTHDEDHLLKILEVKSNRLVTEVGPLPAPRILTFLDSDYPGWTVSIDSRPAELLLACSAFKAVAVPSGQHVIEFKYQPSGLKWYLLLLAATLVGSLAILLISRSREHRERNAAQQSLSVAPDTPELG